MKGVPVHCRICRPGIMVKLTDRYVCPNCGYIMRFANGSEKKVKV